MMLQSNKTQFYILFIGWLFKLELTKPEELDKLMDEKQYEEYLKTDEAH